LAMLDGTPEFLHLFSAAQMPLEPNKNESKKALIALLGLAAFLSVVTAVAMDLVDQRILSASEVRRVIGFPPVGMVIEWDMGTRAFAEEHFRRLINGIQRGIAAQGAKTIVFTPLAHSRTPGFLVTDIGRSLVARGMKTVILDANPLRDEELASGSPAEILALGDVSRSRIQFGDSRVAATIEIISPKEISHLPTVTRMGAALEELSKEYDVILIDAPPLRLSADAEFLASIGDMTLAVVEAGDATRRDLDEGASLLSRIGASSVGVIMSQVRLKHADAAMKRDFKRFSGLTWSTATEGMHS
jgi:succinoglycan biosynthesis transport protein ExoP